VVICEICVYRHHIMTTLITNIKELLQVREENIIKVSGAEMAILPTIKNAYLVITDDLISDFGSMENLTNIKADATIDASGKIVLPSWCDSHTHCLCWKS
jgi:imidazolonepropionase